MTPTLTLVATRTKPLTAVHFERLRDGRLELANPEWPLRLRISAPLVVAEEHISLKDGPKGQMVDIKCSNARAVYMVRGQKDGFILGELVYSEGP